MDNLEYYSPKRKRPLIIVDGKRLRYKSFSMEFIRLTLDCTLSWIDKSDIAYAEQVYCLNNSPIVRRTGRWIIILNTSSIPKDTRVWELKNVFARYEVAASE